MAVGEGHFTLFQFPEIVLNGDMFRQAQVDGAGTDERIGLDRLQLGLGGIGKFKEGADDAYGYFHRRYGLVA